MRDKPYLPKSLDLQKQENLNFIVPDFGFARPGEVEIWV